MSSDSVYSSGAESSVVTSNITSSSSDLSSSDGLRTYNSAADLTEQQIFALDKNEFLFDVNTTHSCVRPMSNFLELLSKSSVPREFSTFTSVALTRTRTVDRFYDHPSLSKYSEIVVYEQTRVRASHKNGHDFMNASWVDGFREIRKFIVTQSPLRSTIGQFYRMIYDRKSHVVVSLVELVDEAGDSFVPKKIGDILRMENMSIELMSIKQVFPYYCSITLKVTKEGGDAKTILLLAYCGWGTTGYPSRPTDILNLVTDMNHMREIIKKKMIEENLLEEKQTFPITLVCFDGLSRSCTIAALDILCQRLQASAALGSPYIDVLDTIARLRMLRAGACPKAEQFIFLSLSIVQFGVSRRIVGKEHLAALDFSRFIIHPEPEHELDF